MAVPPERAVDEFLRSTTVKGLPRVFRRESPACVRLLWFSSFLFGSSVAIYFLSGLISSYHKHEIVISVFENTEHRGFPDLTFCNLNPLGNVRISSEEIRRLIHPDGDLLHVEEGVSPELIFEYLVRNNLTSTDNLVPFILACEWTIHGDEQRDCRGNFTTHIIRSDFGFCHTLSTEFEVLGVSVVLHVDTSKEFVIPSYTVGTQPGLADGILIVVHARGTLPDLNGQAHAIQTAKLTTVKFMEELREKEPEADSRCSKEPTFGFNYSLGEEIVYTVEACTELCHQHAITSTCHCIDGRHMSIEGVRQGHHFCPFNDTLIEFEEARRGLSNLRECFTRAVPEAIFRRCKHQCVPPCTEHRFTITLSSIPWPHPSQQVGFYNDVIKNRNISHEAPNYDEIVSSLEVNLSSGYERLKEQSAFYENFAQINVIGAADYVLEYRDQSAVTFSVLVGSVGGTLNLWVGISFITAVELAELVYHLLLGRFKCEVEPPPYRHPVGTLAHTTAPPDLLY